MKSVGYMVPDSKAVLSVRRAIRHYKPDVVYCHSSKAGAIGRIADIGIKNRNDTGYLIRCLVP